MGQGIMLRVVALRPLATKLAMTQAIVLHAEERQQVAIRPVMDLVILLRVVAWQPSANQRDMVLAMLRRVVGKRMIKFNDNFYIVKISFFFVFFIICSSVSMADNAPMVPPIHARSWLSFVEAFSPPEHKAYLRSFINNNPCGMWSLDCIRTTKILNDISQLRNSEFLPLDNALFLDVVGKARIAQENTKEALAICRESLAIRVAQLGEYDLSTAVSMENLAEALSRRSTHIWNVMNLRDSATEMLGESVELRRKVLNIRMAFMQPESPEVMESITILRNSYLAAGRRIEAEPLTGFIVDYYTSKVKNRRQRGQVEQNNIPNIKNDIVSINQQWSLAQVASLSGNLPLSIEHGMASINRFLSLRSTPDFQSNAKYLEFDFYNNTKSLASWLIDAGRVAEGQQVLGILEKIEYLDYSSIPRKDETPLILPQIPGKLQSLYNKQLELNAKTIKYSIELDEIVKNSAHRDLSVNEITKRSLLQDSLDVARKAYQLTVVDIERQIKIQAPELQGQIQDLNLRLLQPLQSTLKRLGEGTVLVHWVMLDHQTKILLTSANAPPLVYTSPVGYLDLKGKISALRSMLKAPGSSSELMRLSHELYQLLIGPIDSDIRLIHAKTLMLAMHGELRYLPFAALYDGERYLVERFNLVHYSEAVRDRLRDQPNLSSSYAAFGLTNAIHGLDALPGVKLELDGLAQDGWLKGETLLNEQFDKSALLAALDRKPSVLHIASHFVFSPGKEDKSFLLLGSGEKLPISGMHSLRFDGVDLVTLSACETAMGGGKDEIGQEVSGFASLVQDNGAQAVMATLWRVSDASTAQLVREFYRQRQHGKNKAESLRLAQVNVLRGQMQPDMQPERGAIRVDSLPRTTGSETNSAGWSHPYYWAPFILMGNWL